MEGKDATPLSDSLAVHRIGGADIDNFQLKENERQLKPPGISVLLGGTGAEAVQQMKEALSDPAKHDRMQALAKRVATATVGDLRRIGFDVIAKASRRFPNHGRLVHPAGLQGFDQAGLLQLVKVFAEGPP